MRMILCLASLATLLPTTDSTACGPVTPRVHALTSHGTDDGHARTFARLETAVPANTRWRQLARMSYDATAIAPAPPLAAPLQLTLVGTGGARTVATAKQVFLREPWGNRTPTAALDVGPAEGFAIALEGQHDDLAWTALDGERDVDQERERAWLAAHHVAAHGAIRVQRVAAGTQEVVFAFVGDDPVSVLRDGDRVLAQATGTAVGLLAADGFRYLVAEGPHGVVVRTIWGL